MHLTDTYRTFHPQATEYIFFPHAHELFSSIDHILGHKLNLGKYKEIEIICSICPEHNSMRLEIYYLLGGGVKMAEE